MERAWMTAANVFTIAGLRILAPTTWALYEFENFVLGRRDSGGGTLQITTAFRSDCADDPTPACCEACAREWLTQGQVGAFDVQTIGTETEWLGAAGVGSDGMEGRAWYVLRDGQLLLGACPKTSSHIDN